MAEAITTPLVGRCAIVTGGNKGIGFEICKKLAADGVTVVLTARDEKRGREAVDKLKGFGFSHRLVFHQLDVTDSVSVASLVDFIKTTYGKLDILVNNAGISGGLISGDVTIFEKLIIADSLRASGFGDFQQEELENEAKGVVAETYELAEKCLETNYYGAKRMIEAFTPLLHLSDSPRIVNVSSTLGKLKLLSNEWAIGVLSNAESLTEERVDEVINVFLEGYKKDALQAEGWPYFVPGYKLSKAALNAYTRIIARKYPNFCINSVCPGYVKTDMTLNTGKINSEQGAEGPVKLALLPNGEDSGLFFQGLQVSSF